MTTHDQNTNNIANDLYRSLAKVESRLGDLEREVHQDAGVLSSKVEDIKDQLEKLITRHEFTPVKLLVYGLTGSVLAGVIGALLSKVLTK